MRQGVLDLDGALDVLVRNGTIETTRIPNAIATELEALGCVHGRGEIRLARATELLSSERISAGFNALVRDWLEDLEIRPTIGSTNVELMAAAQDASIDGRVLSAEIQTAGRGRRGRGWLSPFARNLAISIGISIDRPLAELGALSLVVGVALHRALESFGLDGVAVKWPNDVLVGKRKLCGVLIELVRAARPAEVVIGFGINVGCRRDVEGEIDQAIADVHDQLPDASRNALFAHVVNHVVADCRRFAREGFAPFRSTWLDAHAFMGEPIQMVLPNDSVRGVIRDIGNDGALIVDTADGLRTFTAGEVSLRAE